MSAWTDKYEGQVVEAFDTSNAFQCVDLASQFCIDHGVPLEAIKCISAWEIYANASDLTRQYFDIIVNMPDAVPQADDMVVWGVNEGPDGHVAIASGEGDINYFVSLDQNWDNVKFCRYIKHNYNGVMGWLRLKNKGGDEVADQTDMNLILHGPRYVNEHPGLDISVDGLINKVAELSGQLDASNKQVTDLEAQLKAAGGATPIDVTVIAKAVVDEQAKRLSNG